MDRNQLAKEMFHQYRRKTDEELETYNRLRMAFPFNRFPKIAQKVWRLAVLAEAWGAIATRLNGGKINYLEQWRIGGTIQ